MIEVKGKYNDAIIYSDRYDDTVKIKQIIKPIYNFKAWQVIAPLV